MNIKKHIEIELKKQGLNVPVTSMNRYISGDRKPTITTAKAIAGVIGSDHLIWLDPELKELRKVALSDYCKNIGGRIYFSAGRPKKSE